MLQWLLLWTVAVLAAVVCFVNILPRVRPSQQFAKNLPGPYFLNVLKAIPYLYSVTPRMCHDLPRQWAKEYKQTYRIWGIGRLTVEVFKASVMETILASSKHTVKGDTYRIVEHFLGEGLLISNGQKWLHRRRILTPAFHFGILQQFLAVFREEGVKLRWAIQERVHSDDGVVDLSPTMSSFTLNTISESSMGVKLDAVTGAKEYRQNIYKIGALVLERFLKVWLHIPIIYKWSLNRWRMDRVLKPVHEFTQQVINKRRRDTGPVEFNNNNSTADNIYTTAEEDVSPKKRRFAMLDTLLLAEARGEIDAEGIKEEVQTFMFEGHDTTASALTYIFLLLAHHQEVQQRVYEEILAVRKAADGPLTISEYNQMSYTDRVIKECLRLYPPVPFIARVLTEDIQIETGQWIPKGVECHLFIFDLHRDEEQFPEPDKFDPDRFLPEEVQKRHPFAYLPFSCGPRNCIGQRFAMLEMKSCLEEILVNFQVLPVTQMEEVILVGDLVLRSQDPIKVKMVNRISGQ